MFCPKCGQQATETTRFCSRCGLALSGLAEWLAAGGSPAARGDEAPAPPPASPRRKGIRRGAKLMFWSVVLFPVFLVLGLLIDEPAPLIVPITIFFVGLCLMLYARLFGAEMPPARSWQHGPPAFGAGHGGGALPAFNAGINSTGAQPVRTAELVRPPSVTEHTTRLLDGDER